MKLKMGAKQNNLIGLKFERLHVISQCESKSYGKTKKRMWLCLCECGKTKITNTGNLTRGNTKSCGCLHNEFSKINSIKSAHKKAKIDSGYNAIFRSYKGNSKIRNLEFDLDFESFKNLLKSNCHYCGIEPSNIYSKNYYNIKYNGIDRIDNKIGYKIQNVVSCCKMCNIAKNNYSHEDFINWINRIVKHNKL